VRRPIGLLAAAAVAIFAAAPAEAVVATSFGHVYAPPVIVVVAGHPATYLNADIDPHDIVATSEAAGQGELPKGARPAGSAPWCADYDGPLRGMLCPLFWTPVLQTGGAHEILGVSDAVPGETYGFYCTLHPYMTGTLVVVDPR